MILNSLPESNNVSQLLTNLKNLGSTSRDRSPVDEVFSRRIRRHSRRSVSCYPLATCRSITSYTDHYYRFVEIWSRGKKKKIPEDRSERERYRARPIYLKSYESEIAAGRRGGTARRFPRAGPPQLFRDEQQLDAALRLKLATRRTATRKLIDVRENSGGGEDGSRASGRRRVLFTWITRAPPYPDALHHRSAVLPLLQEDKARPCAGLTLSNLVTVQQVLNAG